MVSDEDCTLIAQGIRHKAHPKQHTHPILLKKRYLTTHTQTSVEEEVPHYGRLQVDLQWMSAEHYLLTYHTIWIDLVDSSRSYQSMDNMAVCVCAEMGVVDGEESDLLHGKANWSPPLVTSSLKTNTGEGG